MRKINWEREHPSWHGAPHSARSPGGAKECPPKGVCFVAERHESAKWSVWQGRSQSLLRQQGVFCVIGEHVRNECWLCCPAEKHSGACPFGPGNGPPYQGLF